MADSLVQADNSLETDESDPLEAALAHPDVGRNNFAEISEESIKFLFGSIERHVLGDDFVITLAVACGESVDRAVGLALVDVLYLYKLGLLFLLAGLLDRRFLLVLNWGLFGLLSRGGFLLVRRFLLLRGFLLLNLFLGLLDLLGLLALFLGFLALLGLGDHHLHYFVQGFVFAFVGALFYDLGGYGGLGYLLLGVCLILLAHLYL